MMMLMALDTEGGSAPGADIDPISAELAALRAALRVEVARSDFLWDRALVRHMVTEEEYAVAQDPARLAQRG